MSQTGIIILAAGNSSRLGAPKQILVYRQKTLVQHVVEEAHKAHLSPIIIVTGAYADKVFENSPGLQVDIVNNPEWQQGIGSSIAAGINRIIGLANVDNVIVAVCDQPFISASLFEWLVNERLQTGKELIACSYADTIGTPVLFSRKYFKELSQLKGGEGAKKLLQRYHDYAAVIEFPGGEIDIDTKEDYEMLVNGNIN